MSGERGLPGARRDHPAPAALVRFLRGETSRAERRAIVRHLLTGCRTCVAVTRPIWSLANRPAVGGDALERPGHPRRSRRDSRCPAR